MVYATQQADYPQNVNQNYCVFFDMLSAVVQFCSRFCYTNQITKEKQCQKQNIEIQVNGLYSTCK